MPSELTNLAEDLDEKTLDEIGEQVFEEFDVDKTDRKRWDEKHAEWIRLYNQEDERIADLADWGSEDSLPVLAEAVNQFTSRAQKAFFPNLGTEALHVLQLPGHFRVEDLDRVIDRHLGALVQGRRLVDVPHVPGRQEALYFVDTDLLRQNGPFGHVPSAAFPGAALPDRGILAIRESPIKKKTSPGLEVRLPGSALEIAARNFVRLVFPFGGSYAKVFG